MPSRPLQPAIAATVLRTGGPGVFTCLAERVPIRLGADPERLLAPDWAPIP